MIHREKQLAPMQAEIEEVAAQQEGTKNHIWKHMDKYGSISRGSETLQRLIPVVLGMISPKCLMQRST